ncbi:MAG: hypothetical protein GZ090_11540 [Oxalobacteraceae bacterium]|nr:hypothetical protein [Oxalobacteraceae bacterium]
MSGATVSTAKIGVSGRTELGSMVDMAGFHSMVSQHEKDGQEGKIRSSVPVRDSAGAGINIPEDISQKKPIVYPKAISPHTKKSIPARLSEDFVTSGNDLHQDD